MSLRFFTNLLKRIEYRRHGVVCHSSAVPRFNGEMEHGVWIGRGVTIGAARIGRHSFVGEGVKIGDAEIGPFCSIASYCGIGLGLHPMHFVSTHAFCYLKSRNFVAEDYFDRRERGRAVIGADVWLGYGSQVLSGVTIGHGAVLAAGAIATRNISPYAVASGVPARVQRFRFDEDIRNALLAIEWWNWDDARLRASASEFSNPREFVARHLRG